VRYKLLFIAVCLATELIGGLALRIWAPSVASSAIPTVIGGLVIAAFVIVGARIFRGKNEKVAPARNWWRFTAAPTSGFVITGALFLEILLSVQPLLVAIPTAGSAVIVSHVFQFCLWSCGVLIYLQSSVRLQRLRRATTQP
jgi:hypothetical protein